MRFLVAEKSSLSVRSDASLLLAVKRGGGKLKKFFSEVCLLEQPFIKDSDKTVQDLLNEMMAKTGENILIRRFVRYQLGDMEA